MPYNLYDALTRHQIYLEGVKLNRSKQFSTVLLDIMQELRILFANIEYDSLDQLTKQKLGSFIQALKNAQYRIYDKYTTDIYNFIEAFIEADVAVNLTILDDNVEEKDSNYINSLLLTTFSTARILGRINSTPIPANGVYIKPFMTNFINSAVNSVLNKTVQGYANGWTKQQTLNEIIGTNAANYRDGSLSRISKQADAVVGTVLQHVSAMTQLIMHRELFEYGQWVSVLDFSTTEICERRNGKVFRYSEGPFPPAHINCRSKFIPIPTNNPIDESNETYYSWIKRQPTAVQDDILGEQKAASLRNGKLKSSDLPKFVNNKSVTLAQFRDKTDLMTTN